MAACISTAATTHAMKSSVDLNDWKNSLHDIKAEEIFELIEKAIDIAASQYPKEFIQRTERMAKMLLNSKLKYSCPDEITTCHTEYMERKNSADVRNNGSECPPLDEAERFLADVISFDPAKLFSEIDDLDDDIYRDIEANNEKSLNEDSQKPSSCSSMTENKLGCAQDLKPHNETNPKPDASES